MVKINFANHFYLMAKLYWCPIMSENSSFFIPFLIGLVLQVWGIWSVMEFFFNNPMAIKYDVE